MGRFRFHRVELLILLAAVALALAGCAQRSIYDLKESDIDYNETVPLHFEWPAGMVAQVDSVVQKSRTVGETVTTESVTVQCSLHTESAGGGIKVLCENVTTDGDKALKVFLDGAPGLLAQPILRVDSHGEITKIEGLNGVEGALERAVAGTSGRSTNRREIIEVLSNPGAVSRIASLDWWNLVAFWNGKALKTGTTYTLRRQAAVPIYDRDIDWVQQYRLAGRVPCNEREQPARRCVKLVLTSTPDETQFSQAVKDIVKSAEGPHMHRKSHKVVLRKVQYQYTLVTLPERLFPYWVEDRRTMELETAGADGKPVTMDAVQVRHDSYEYFSTGIEKGMK